MDNSIQQFSFEGEYEIRVADRDGESRFVASDVCKALAIINVSDAVDRLDDDEKDNIVLNDAIGRARSMLCVTESGLYSLILRSNKPEAKAFKRWVTHEVIPALRKTGSYSMQPLTPLQQLRAFVDALETQEAAIQETAFELMLVKNDVQEDRHRIEQLEAITVSSTEYFTVVGYYNLRKLGNLTKYEAQVIGRRAAKLSRDQGITIKDVPNTEHGTVHAYHISILDEIANSSVD